MALHRISWRKKLLVIPLILVIITGAAGFLYVRPSEGATYTWDGGGTTNDWSDCDNWSTNICPSSTDSVIFNSTSTKNSTIDAGWGGTIATFSINSGYTGTITSDRSLILTGSFTQSDGTFIAPSTSIDINVSLTLTGGTFNHNNGTINFNTTANVDQTVTCTGSPFNLVTVNQANSSASFWVKAGCTVPLGDNPTVRVGFSGQINDGGNINNSALAVYGTISGSGSLTVTSYFNESSTYGANLYLNCGSSCLTGFDGLHITNNGLNNGVLVVNGSGTTIDPTAYSPFTINGLQVSNTASFISDTSLSLTGNFTLSDTATFTAPSGTMDIGGIVTIANTATFNHNNGTVNLNAPYNIDQSITCTGNPFNLVTINQTDSAASIWVKEGCTLPLGNNPTVVVGYSGQINDGGNVTNSAIAVYGSLTGTGTLTVEGYYNPTTSYGGNVYLKCGSDTCLSGFTGLDTIENYLFNGGYLTLAGTGTELDTTSYSSPVDLGGLTLLDSTIFVAGNTTDIAGAQSLTISGTSTFTAPSNTMDIGGHVTIADSATFNHNNGTINLAAKVNFDQTVTCTGSPFNLVTVNQTDSSSSLWVKAGCTLPLGNNPTVTVGYSGQINDGGNIQNSALAIYGGISGTGTLNLVGYFNGSTYYGGSIYLNCGSSTCISGFTGMELTNSTLNSGNLTLNSAGTELDATGYSSITINNLTINSNTTLTAPSGGILNIKSNMTPTGIFDHNQGTVLLSGTSSQYIYGDITFYNLTLSRPNNQYTYFEAGKTKTVENQLTINGSSNYHFLRSTTNGQPWYLDVSGPVSIKNVAVQDSDASAGRPILATSSRDDGNNENWIIEAAASNGKSFFFRGVTINGGATITSN